MNALLPDTNVLIDFFKGDAAAAGTIASFDRILLCTTVLGEYKAGIDCTTKAGRAYAVKLAAFMEDPAVRVVGGTVITADYYARVFQELKRKGSPIPQNDLWIAAFALEHSATLFSHDTHFSDIPMLKLC